MEKKTSLKFETVGIIEQKENNSYVLCIFAICPQHT
jgi:hypothetical protein